MMIKKIILILLSTCFLVGLNAQTEETTDKYIIGASTNFGIHAIGVSKTTTEPRSNHISISPYVGKVLNENWTIGIFGNFAARKIIENLKIKSRSGTWYSSINQEFSQDLGIGIFSRYHFNPQNALKIYLEPNINYTKHFISNSAYDPTRSNSFSVNVSIKAGLLYDINAKTRMTMQLGDLSFLYKNYEKNFETNHRTTFDVNTNFKPSNIRLGVEFKF